MHENQKVLRICIISGLILYIMKFLGPLTLKGNNFLKKNWSRVPMKFFADYMWYNVHFVPERKKKAAWKSYPIVTNTFVEVYHQPFQDVGTYSEIVKQL